MFEDVDVLDVDNEQKKTQHCNWWDTTTEIIRAGSDSDNHNMLSAVR